MTTRSPALIHDSIRVSAIGSKWRAASIRLKIVFSPSTIDRDDATIRPVRRSRHPVRLHAFASETRTNALAERVIANWGDKANRRAAARRDDRLIGALAAKIFRGSESHDRFTGPRKPLHSNDAVDRGVADHMDHLGPLSATHRPVSARDARRRKPGADSRSGYASIVRWSMPWRFRRGTKCLRI